MGNIKGRSTVYNNITSEEKMKQVNPENIELENDYIEYLESTDRADSTIKQYIANLHVFWCWNLEFNNNKFFVDLTKREIIRFQNHCINTWGWSPKRIRTVKSTLSSLSNYISNILDMDFPNFRPIINKIESPTNETVREKTVLNDEQTQTLLDNLVNKKEYMKAALFALALYSGRRKSELPRFKVSYFTEDNLICDGALYATPEKVVTKGRGKRGKLLTLYTIAKPFQPYLDLWLKQRNELGIESDWLFPKKEGNQWLDEPISTSTIDSWFQTFARMMDTPIYPHSLRHRWCTSLSEQGLPEKVIQKLSGWQDISLVSVYDDTEVEDTFAQYFGADGIKQVEQKGLNDL